MTRKMALQLGESRSTKENESRDVVRLGAVLPYDLNVLGQGIAERLVSQKEVEIRRPAPASPCPPARTPAPAHNSIAGGAA